MTAYGGVEVQSHSFLTYVLEVDVWYKGGSKSFLPDQLFKVTEINHLCYFSIQSPFISTYTDTDILTSP
jgi:hypothetical protein